MIQALLRQDYQIIDQSLTKLFCMSGKRTDKYPVEKRVIMRGEYIE